MFIQYVMLFYRLCVIIEPKGSVTQKMRTVDQDQLIHMIAANGSTIMKRHLSRVLYQFSDKGSWSGYIPEWQTWRPVLRREVGYKPQKRQLERRSFTTDEIDRLFFVAAEDPRDEALLSFYIHTGCRSSAAVELLVDDIWNTETQQVRERGVVLEKGHTSFVFYVDDILAAALRRWILASDGTKYVFPSLKDCHRQWHNNGPRGWLLNICKRAGISGSHVHIHALRRTICTLLYQHGATRKELSTFLGHRCWETTRGYIDAPLRPKRPRTN
jgi:integrase